MNQRRPSRFHRNQVFALSLFVGAGSLFACGAGVYPASECKPPPPPKTIPNSPRSQCREVSTEHAKDWPQKYKDVQYAEENAIYYVRVAFSELADTTQKGMQSEFAQAVSEINNADGKYLQLIDAAVAANNSEFDQPTKMISKATTKFVNFLETHLETKQMTDGAKSNLEKAKAALQGLKSKANPPPAPGEEGSGAEGSGTEDGDKAADPKSDDPNDYDGHVIKT